MSFLDSPVTTENERGFKNVIGRHYGNRNEQIKSQYATRKDGTGFNADVKKSLAQRLVSLESDSVNERAAIGSTAIAGNPYSYDVSPIVNGVIGMALAPLQKRVSEERAEVVSSLDDQMDRKQEYDELKTEERRAIFSNEEQRLQAELGFDSMTEGRRYQEGQLEEGRQREDQQLKDGNERQDELRTEQNQENRDFLQWKYENGYVAKNGRYNSGGRAGEDPDAEYDYARSGSRYIQSLESRIQELNTPEKLQDPNMAQLLNDLRSERETVGRLYGHLDNMGESNKGEEYAAGLLLEGQALMSNDFSGDKYRQRAAQIFPMIYQMAGYLNPNDAGYAKERSLLVDQIRKSGIPLTYAIEIVDEILGDKNGDESDSSENPEIVGEGQQSVPSRSDRPLGNVTDRGSIGRGNNVWTP